MYRQVNNNAGQRDLKRISWHDSTDQELAYYTLNTVTYGTTSATVFAIRLLHQVAKDNANTFSMTCNVILSDFYIDNLITGDNTIAELKRSKAEIYGKLQSAGFN